MNDITALAQRMKAAAIRAKAATEGYMCDRVSYTAYMSEIEEFVELTDESENVLALVEALEARDKQITELVAGRLNLLRTMGVYVHAYEEAKEQIAKDVEIKARLCRESNSLFDRLRAAEKRNAELEKAASEPVAWTEKCEITNMQATGLYLRGFPDSSHGRDIALYTMPPALESRTFTVKLYDDFQLCHYGTTEDYAKGYIDCQNNFTKWLAAAGIQVIEGEGQCGAE